MATIYRDVPLEIDDLESIKYEPNDNKELYELYQELEFYSLTKDMKKEKLELKNKILIPDIIHKVLYYQLVHI